jgi:uncharacterized protein YceH (UPF0502 family)
VRQPVLCTPRPPCDPRHVALATQALEKGLLKYNELLTSRTSKMSDVASLSQQNNELKALLNQYLASRVRARAVRAARCALFCGAFDARAGSYCTLSSIVTRSCSDRAALAAMVAKSRLF